MKILNFIIPIMVVVSTAASTKGCSKTDQVEKTQVQQDEEKLISKWVRESNQVGSN